jgi:hypothetical protein
MEKIECEKALERQNLQEQRDPFFAEAMANACWECLTPEENKELLMSIRSINFWEDQKAIREFLNDPRYNFTDEQKRMNPMLLRIELRKFFDAQREEHETQSVAMKLWERMTKEDIKKLQILVRSDDSEAAYELLKQYNHGFSKEENLVDLEQLCVHLQKILDEGQRVSRAVQGQIEEKVSLLG